MGDKNSSLVESQGFVSKVRTGLVNSWIIGKIQLRVGH